MRLARFLALLAVTGCAASPTEPTATARVCAIRPGTNALLAAPDTLYEVVLTCTPTPRLR